MRNRRRAVLAGLLALALLGGVFGHSWYKRYAARQNLGLQVEAAGEELAGNSPDKPPPFEAPVYRERPKARIVTDEERQQALRRARVWLPPEVPVGAATFDLSSAPNATDCRFVVTELGGTTPKFDCVLRNGELIRVKYGKGPEIPAELAATRLLRALGFPADRVTLVDRLECYGCPNEPFSTMKAVELTRAEDVYKKLVIDYRKPEVFDWVTIERRFDGRSIATKKLEGFNFFELDTIDPAQGGSPRAHVDALRLLAVFLAYWDNKPDNQRLVCTSQDDWKDGERCAATVAMLQDLGATFGPHKVDLERWRSLKLWDDARSCRVSMSDLPYDGATFQPVHISEAGRQHLLHLLSALTDRQLTDLFASSRFDEARGLPPKSWPIADWVTAFKARVRLIADHAPCPET